MAKHEVQKMRGAVLYSRVSTDGQDKHGTSPETQRDACRAKALALGLPIVSEYHDGGVSGGFLLARPGMQAALADIRAGYADTLICPNLSRFSRDVEHQQAIKKEVKAAGGWLVFCDMEFADTPEGDLNFTIQGGFAEYEKAVIKKRMEGGRQKKAEQGIQPSRRTSPYGYTIATHADVLRGQAAYDMAGRYQVREDQAVYVRRMFADYHSKRHSLAHIARQLTQEGVPTPGRSTQWSQSTICYILANPVYKGVAVYGRFDNFMDESRLQKQHWLTGELLKEPRFRRKADPETWVTMNCPALVSADVWEEVQARLVENKAKKGGNPLRVRMLAGRIVCPHCGGTLVAGSKTRRTRQGGLGPAPQRYICGRYMSSLQKTGQAQCQPTSYLCEDVEAATIAAILDAAHRPEALAAALAAYQKKLPAETPAPEARRELARLDKALEALAGEQAATVQAQISGIMQGAPVDAYAAAFADLAARRKTIEGQRSLLMRQLKNKPGSDQSSRDQSSNQTSRDETGQITRANVPAKQADSRSKKSSQATQSPQAKQSLQQQALADVARVLSSPVLLGNVKRDALAHLIESVMPRRDTQPREEMEVMVHFVPGVFLPDVFAPDVLVPGVLNTGGSQKPKESSSDAPGTKGLEDGPGSEVEDGTGSEVENGPEGEGELVETLQSIRLGSLRTRALFSSIRASSWAASGISR